jgi:hypothetical protein
VIEPEPRRLPAPWTVREVTGGYVVLDATGRRLAYIYGEPGGRGANNDTLTPEEARRVAVNIAKLPDF